MESQYLTKGKQLCEQGKFEQAIAVFETGLTETPDNIDLLYNLSKASALHSDYERALKCLEAILNNKPEDANIISERAVVFHQLGQNQAALKDLDKAVILEPDNPFRYSSRAWVRAKAGDVKGAISDYEKAVGLDPEDAIAYNNMGLLQEQLGYKEKAKKSFGKSDQLIDYVSPEQKTHIDAIPYPVSNEEMVRAEKMNFPHVISVMKKLISSRQARRDFISFLKRTVLGN